MNAQKKPLLSIGMIFKNEIRCLERCMKSLQPLRDAIPCELVMADTGSDDGSREVAERYADILFDFPWIDDFAAARNAVMDRCSGKWYFSIDADEWLDEHIAQLVNYLKAGDKQPSFWSVMIRNYSTEELKNNYSDFLAIRLIRMSTGIRFIGAIHEHWPLTPGLLCLGRTILHHDGYVCLSTEKGKAKLERNMKLLRKALEENPKNMRTLMECVESSSGSGEYEGFLRRAIEGVEKKFPGWELFGPPIVRYAVTYAYNSGLSEVEIWREMAHNLFPDSPFTTIDTSFSEFFGLQKEKKYSEAIQAGERYLKALADYRKGNLDPAAMISCCLLTIAEGPEYDLRLQLADAYLHEEQYQQAQDVLKELDVDRMNSQTLTMYFGDLLNLHAQSGVNLAQEASDLWKRVCSGEVDLDCQKKIFTTAALVFQRKYRQAEDEKGYRHAYTAFLPLEGKYEIGTAAAILEETDPVMMAEKLSRIENWGKFPIQALAYALEYGVSFPLAERPLHIEEMDKLANRLAADKEIFLPQAVRIAEKASDETAQQLAWKRGVMVAAVRAFGWSDKEADAELGLAIAREFARIEKVFLPSCYALDAFREKNLFLLPAMHRFGWFCAQAFDALETGDLPGFLRCLRQGLSACEAVQPMVEFLSEHTPQLQKPKPSGELLELAEKVRMMLSAYAPDDPAVMMIKQSAAYQKVAQLIEGPDLGVLGGLAQ